jgi:hypothetical protein
LKPRRAATVAVPKRTKLRPTLRKKVAVAVPAREAVKRNRTASSSRLLLRPVSVGGSWPAALTCTKPIIPKLPVGPPCSSQ